MKLVGMGMLASELYCGPPNWSIVFPPMRGKGKKFVRKRPKRKPKKKKPEKPHKCSCESWTLADALWQAMTPEEKQVWKDAVKKRGMSGYDLWMKEALGCFNLNKNSPFQPGPSGGYSHIGVDCTGGTTAPESCAPPEPPPPPWENPDGEECENCHGPAPLYFSIFFPENASPCAQPPGWATMQQQPFEPCTWEGTPEERLWKFNLEIDLRVLLIDHPDPGAEGSLTYLVPGEPGLCQTDHLMEYIDCWGDCCHPYTPLTLLVRPGRPAP